MTWWNDVVEWVAELVGTLKTEQHWTELRAAEQETELRAGKKILYEQVKQVQKPGETKNPKPNPNWKPVIVASWLQRTDTPPQDDSTRG